MMVGALTPVVSKGTFAHLRQSKYCFRTLGNGEGGRSVPRDGRNGDGEDAFEILPPRRVGHLPRTPALCTINETSKSFHRPHRLTGSPDSSSALPTPPAHPQSSPASPSPSSPRSPQTTVSDQSSSSRPRPHHPARTPPRSKYSGTSRT